MIQYQPWDGQHIERLTALQQAAIHQTAASHYNLAQRHAWAPETPDLDAWRERLGQLQVIVAHAGKQPAGFIGHCPQGHIDLLFTHPDHGRQGIASHLLQTAEAALRQAGASRAFTEASQTSRPLFARHGYRLITPETIQLRGQTFLRYRMEKPLH